MATRSRSDARGKRFWDRLVAWYGTRITEQYGKEPPEDWVAIVDDNDNDTVRHVLSLIRQKHVTHPPTFPEVAALFAASIPKPKVTGPSTQQRLANYAMRHCTSEQVRLPWTYLYRGSAERGSQDSEICGVKIPAAGANPGKRIMIEDLELGS